MGRIEVVHVAKVGRRRLPRGALVQDEPHQSALTRTRRAEGAEMVALAPDAGAEAQCLERARLAQDGVERLQVGRGLEPELGGIAAAVELRRFERSKSRRSLPGDPRSFQPT